MGLCCLCFAVESVEFLLLDVGAYLGDGFLDGGLGDWAAFGRERRRLISGADGAPGIERLRALVPLAKSNEIV